MRKKVIKISTIISIILLITVIMPLDIFAKMDTSVNLGSESDLKSSKEIIERMLGVAQIIGSTVSIIALIIIGLRYMLGSLEQRAALKGVLAYYVIGCILVFSTSNVLGFAYEVINDIRHDWDDGSETTSPTCIGTGILTYTCITCGEQRREVIPETGVHIWDSGIVDLEPTCVSQGTRIFSCIYGCGATEVGDIPININNHAWDSGTIDPAPTCFSAGKKTIRCGRNGCGESKEEYIPQLTHRWSHTVDAIRWDQITGATCTEDGLEERICLNGCGSREERTIPATGHDWVTGAGTEPTCGANGVAREVCNNGCGEEKIWTLYATGEHTWNGGTVTQNPTCSTKGKTKYTCTVCGKTEESEDIESLGHQSEGAGWSWDPSPSCTSGGTKKYTCARQGCSAVVKTESVGATGHRYYTYTGTKKWNGVFKGCYIYEFKCRNCDHKKWNQEEDGTGNWVD